MIFFTESASRRTKTRSSRGRRDHGGEPATSERGTFTENATVESVSGGSHAASIAQPVVAAGLILKAIEAS